MARFLTTIAAAALACVFSTPIASAQFSKTGCSLHRVAGTSRQILRCQKGLTITLESGAKFILLDRNHDGKVDAAKLRRKALLLEEPDSNANNRFQVATPQAIAAVRGTKWTVDVNGNKTSIFVVRGHVAVRRPAAKAGVVLGPGEGVDVEKGTGRLIVRRWPAARVSALLARFGQ